MVNYKVFFVVIYNLRKTQLIKMLSIVVYDVCAHTTLATCASNNLHICMYTPLFIFLEYMPGLQYQDARFYKCCLEV